MLVSELAPANESPLVQALLVNHIDMQFSDVRAMLQLPRPELGIEPGCNFAIVSTLCNLVSGVSTTIYMPTESPDKDKWPVGEVRWPGFQTGKAFRGLVQDFFPIVGDQDRSQFAKNLYDLARNPMAHSAGIMDANSPTVEFRRVFDPSHPNKGWNAKELEDLERPDRPFNLPPGITDESGSWIVNCDSLYLDVIEMLRRLNSDSQQMNAAENRFGQGVYTWHRKT